MSKGGGAGKVYFVLYLAVVLELLIIIVERDEAEEHLRSKTKQAMKIVESILSQLQSGAGTEGINTRPQDEITIPPPGIDIKEIFGTDLKSFRQYTVEVGVTDVASSLGKKENETGKEYVERLKKLVKLANVEQLQYQIFYSPNQDPANAPLFPSDDYFKKNNIDPLKMQPGEMLKTEDPTVEWKLLSVRELNLDEEATFNKINLSNVDLAQISPLYPNNLSKGIGEKYSPPNMPEDSVFFYSDVESMKLRTKAGLAKRSFVVYFQPPNNAGWYKLRFASRTNRILGVKGGQQASDVKDDATVNIGTVQLTVADLRKVMKELHRKLESFDLPTVESLSQSGDISGFDEKLVAAKTKAFTQEKGEEIAGNINLYGYIVKLLAPGQSVNFDQNRGSIEFNVRVVTPQPKMAKPTITSIPEYIPSFDKLPAVFGFDISPYQGTSNQVDGRVFDAANNVVARLNLQPLDQIAGMNISAPTNGSSRQYRATVDKELPKGKYKVELNHTIGSQKDQKTATLEIFESTLSKESENKLTSYLNTFAYFGYPLNFAVEPSSGGKIKANQFRIYLLPNGNNQVEPYEGLSVPQNAFKLTPDIKDVTVKVTWVQDATGKEIDIFPASKFVVKQDEPKISFNRSSTDYSGTSNKFKVTISNISVTRPITGNDAKPAQVKVDIKGEAQKKNGLGGYSITSSIIEGDPDGGYTIEIELTGKLERGQTKVSGQIDVPIVAIATNTENGVKSEARTQTLQVNVNYEPNRGGPVRRSR
ncbi:MAG TPA: hypothetical protein PLE30_05075 [Candidatus Kapabacteria bacterium]|nr:hypothetical protein [Candidatus Kapabacteria bacterium]